MRTSGMLMAAIVLAGGLSCGLPIRADEPPPTAGAAAMDEAQAMMDRMASFLAQADHFSVDLRTGYDAVQEQGQKIEFLERRSILISRPDRLRLEVERSDGESVLLLFDGKDVTAFLGTENVYAQAHRPGSVDDAVAFIVRELQTRVPLALLLTTQLPGELSKRFETVAFVERSQATPVPTNHIAARTDEVDVQMWIAAEGDPLPYRLVITYRDAPGAPQFWADFSGWDLSPDVSPERFAFSPPSGAEQIPFMARVHGSGGAQ